VNARSNWPPRDPGVRPRPSRARWLLLRSDTVNGAGFLNAGLLAESPEGPVFFFTEPGATKRTDAIVSHRAGGGEGRSRPRERTRGIEARTKTLVAAAATTTRWTPRGNAPPRARARRRGRPRRARRRVVDRGRGTTRFRDRRTEGRTVRVSSRRRLLVVVLALVRQRRQQRRVALDVLPRRAVRARASVVRPRERRAFDDFLAVFPPSVPVVDAGHDAREDVRALASRACCACRGLRARARARAEAVDIERAAGPREWARASECRDPGNEATNIIDRSSQLSALSVNVFLLAG